VYNQLIWCVKQDNEQLARSGTNCFENLVISCGMKFDEKTWRSTIDCIFEIFKSTVPVTMLTWKPAELANKSNESDKASNIYPETSNITNKIFLTIKIKCVAQLELIQTIDNIVFFPSTSRKEDIELIHEIEQEMGLRKSVQSSATPHKPTTIIKKEYKDEHSQQEQLGMYSYMSTSILLQLSDCLLESHEFAKSFNLNANQRNLLWKAGFLGNSKPNLLSQEAHSITCALRILFKLYDDEKREEGRERIEAKLTAICQSALQYYHSLEGEMHRETWTPVILLILSKLNKLSDDKVRALTESAIITSTDH